MSKEGILLKRFNSIVFIFFIYITPLHSTEWRLVVPAVSRHVGGGVDVGAVNTSAKPAPGYSASPSIAPVQTNNTSLNDNNYGIGIELVDDGVFYSLILINSNSYKKTSAFVGVSKEIKISANIYYSYGVTVANGYSDLNGSSYLVSPNMTLRYKNIRVLTTYPAAAILCKKNECADIINLQYVMPF